MQIKYLDKTENFLEFLVKENLTKQLLYACFQLLSTS